MKKFNLIAFTFLIILGLTGWLAYFQKNTVSSTGQELGAQSQPSDFQKIWGKKEVIIGLDDAYPPIGFRDEKGQLIGFDIDLAKATFERIGLKPIFKPVAWDGVILTLKNKEIDIIWNGMTITDSRRQQIDFSRAYLTGSDDFIIRSNSGILKPEDLQNKLVGVQTGSTQEKELQSTPGIYNSVRSYATNDEAFLDLKSGRLDALLIDNFVGRYYITNINKDGNYYSVISGGFGDNKAGVGIRKEDTALREAIDQALKQLKDDGTAQSISNKWFGSDLISQ